MKDSLVGLVDHYGKDELIYLGPDEQVLVLCCVLFMGVCMYCDDFSFSLSLSVLYIRFIISFTLWCVCICLFVSVLFQNLLIHSGDSVGY